MDRVPFHNRPKVVDLTTETKLPDRITETQLLCGEVRGHNVWPRVHAHRLHSS